MLFLPKHFSQMGFGSLQPTTESCGQGRKSWVFKKKKNTARAVVDKLLVLCKLVCRIHPIKFQNSLLSKVILVYCISEGCCFSTVLYGALKSCPSLFRPKSILFSLLDAQHKRANCPLEPPHPQCLED